MQVCSANGLRSIFKFSEILGSTSYVSGTTPAEWNSVIVIPVYKKGDMKDPYSYRGINFLNSCYKIYTKILNEKLKKYSETCLDDTQSGFKIG